MSASAITTGRHIALLRGINVGGKNKLPMKQLVSIFEAAGCTDVQTYIQSGNVVFAASAALLKQLATRIPHAIEAELGLSVPVVLRSATQFAKAVRANPFSDEAAADPKSVHVSFLRDKPTRRALARLDPNRSPPDEIRCVGSEIYTYCPNGVARSKFTAAYFDRELETVCTARNWRTTLKLLDLLR